MLELVACEFENCDQLMTKDEVNLGFLLDMKKIITLCTRHNKAFWEWRDRTIASVYRFSSHETRPWGPSLYDNQVEETEVMPLPKGLANAIGLTGCHCVSPRVSNVEETSLTKETTRTCHGTAGEPQWFEARVTVKPYGADE